LTPSPSRSGQGSFLEGSFAQGEPLSVACQTAGLAVEPGVVYEVFLRLGEDRWEPRRRRAPDRGAPTLLARPPGLAVLRPKEYEGPAPVGKGQGVRRRRAAHG